MSRDILYHSIFAVHRGLYYPANIGLMISHYKDHYEPIRVSWNVMSGFWLLPTCQWWLKNNNTLLIRRSLVEVEA